MSWTTQETIIFGADTVLRQIGDQVVDLGHRVAVNGTPGTAAPLASIAKLGAYRATQANFNLQDGTLLPTLFKVAITEGSSFPAGPATVTVNMLNIGTADSSFAICDGTGEMHSWVIANAAGGNSSSFLLDYGGGPDDTTFAGFIKTQIDALAIAGLTVSNSSGVLTLTSANGITAYSSDAGVVVS